MAYTPTEEELLEMGFKKHGRFFTLDVGPFRISYWSIAAKNGLWDTRLRAETPSNKKHLESIILAFTKPE